jgi:excisionase family DNA binding protein
MSAYAEVTTQQAAEIARVSGSDLGALLDAGTIECRVVGTRRRVRYSSLVAYLEAHDTRRRALA